MHCKILLHLFLLTILTQSSFEFCPPKCTCDREVFVSCSNANLDVVPIQLNPTVRYVNLTRNHIFSIHFTLNFYNNLRVLDLSYNQLTDIGHGNFESQIYLRVLFLDGNQIEIVKHRAFVGLHDLTELSLKHNKILYIHRDAFNDMKKLKWLDIAHNHLSQIESSSLRNLCNLQFLSVKNNKIADVFADGSWECTKNMRHLDLSMNLLRYLDDATFDPLESLTWLNLSNNLFSSVGQTSFRALVNLRTLDLSNNMFETIPSTELSSLKQLTHLVFNGNLVHHIPARAFPKLQHLKELHLSNLTSLQNISDRALIENTELQKLELSCNSQLSELPANLFQTNQKLTEISIQKNNLSQLQQHQLPVHQLQRLTLGYNPFKCDCSLMWLWQLVPLSRTQVSQHSSGGVAQRVGTSSSDSSLQLTDIDSVYCFQRNGETSEQIKLTDMDDFHADCNRFLNPFICAIVIIFTLLFILISYYRCKYLSSRDNILHATTAHEIIEKRSELERYLSEKPLIRRVPGGAPPEWDATHHEHFSTLNSSSRESEFYPFFSNSPNKNQKDVQTVVFV